jgi:hypothetical protein
MNIFLQKPVSQLSLIFSVVYSMISLNTLIVVHEKVTLQTDNLVL